MRLFSAFATVACLGVLVPLAASVPSQRQAPRAAKAPAAHATAKIVAAAQAVSASLTNAGRQKLQFAFDDPVKAHRLVEPSSHHGRAQRHQAR